MKKLLTALVASLSLSVPAVAQSNHEHHQQLWVALQTVGVNTQVNSVECFRRNGEIDGYYMSVTQTLVVCQNNAGKIGQPVYWTENDYDTLRHEAMHVIQDCVDGELGDGELALLFSNDQEFNQFVRSKLTDDQISSILRWYSDISPRRQQQEIEAFAVARGVNVTYITEAVNKVCGNDI